MVPDDQLLLSYDKDGNVYKTLYVQGRTTNRWKFSKSITDLEINRDQQELFILSTDTLFDVEYDQGY